MIIVLISLQHILALMALQTNVEERRVETPDKAFGKVIGDTAYYFVEDKQLQFEETFSEEQFMTPLLLRIKKNSYMDLAKQFQPSFSSLQYQSFYQSLLDFGNAVTLGVYSLVLGLLTWVTIEIVTNNELLCT